MSFLTFTDFTISYTYDFILRNIKEDIFDPVKIHSLDKKKKKKDLLVWNNTMLCNGRIFICV